MNDSALEIELWHVPDCPLVERVRTTLRRCLERAGTAATVREWEGPYPSPTLLIDGIDVATGTAPVRDLCCRLDLPTEEQILAALAREPT